MVKMFKINEKMLNLRDFTHFKLLMVKVYG